MSAAVSHPESVSVLGKSFIQVTSLRHLTRNGKKRRIGLSYWVKYSQGDETLFWMYKLDEKSDKNWLKSVIDLGCLYLEKFDYDIIKATLDKQ